MFLLKTNILLKMGNISHENFNCITENVDIKTKLINKITCDLGIGLFNTSKGYIIITVLST